METTTLRFVQSILSQKQLDGARNALDTALQPLRAYAKLPATLTRNIMGNMHEFNIACAHSGKVLDAVNGAVVQRTYTGSDSQKWTLYDLSSILELLGVQLPVNVMTLENVATGQSLTFPALHRQLHLEPHKDTTGEGAGALAMALAANFNKYFFAVERRTSAGAEEQEVIIVPVTSALQAFAVLDVEGASQDDGARVILWPVKTLTDNRNQHFILKKLGPSKRAQQMVSSLRAHDARVDQFFGAQALDRLFGPRRS